MNHSNLRPDVPRLRESYQSFIDRLREEFPDTYAVIHIDKLHRKPVGLIEIMPGVEIIGERFGEEFECKTLDEAIAKLKHKPNR